MKFISNIFASASGSIAGTTFSRNANGAYTRNRSVPINRNTDSQKASRAAFSAAAANWRSLTAAQKQSFVDNAPLYTYVDSLGQTKQYTGRQLSAKLNNTLIQGGVGTFLTSCLPPVPDVSVLYALVEISKQLDFMKLIEFESEPGNAGLPTNWRCNIYATAVAAGVSKAFKRSDFRQIAQLSDGPATLPVDLNAAYVAVFGNGWLNAPSNGACIGFGFLCFNTVTGQSNASMYQLLVPITN